MNRLGEEIEKTAWGPRRAAIIGGLWLLLLLCLPASGPAAEAAAGKAGPRLLTLAEALAIAAANNRDIEKARAFMAWTEGKYLEERAAALPKLTAIGSLSQDRDEGQKILGPAMTKWNQRGLAQISLTQPLFTWGQVSAAIRAAKVGLQSADEQLRVYQQAAGRDVSAAFYDVLLAREMQALAVQNLEQKKRHREEAQRKYQSGVATDYDVLAAEVSLENARPEAIRSDNAIRTARERLRFLLALEGEEIDATGNLEAQPGPGLSYEAAFALACRKRPDLADLRYRIGIYQEQVVLAASQDKPRLDLKGAYGWKSLEQKDAYGDGPAWDVGVQLSYPFFDGLRTKGRVIQADSDLKRARIDEAKQIDAIALETRSAVNALQESGEIVRALGGAVTQAERLLAMAEKGYALGVKTRLEVEDAELNLRQAKSSLSRARRDLLVARVNLDWVTGVLGEKEP
ncbi:MAG: TolC family protein [Deltaproteobacteria bacterium]|nr:TolC family protein [Deltaproteobacteria bacterium]